MKRKIAMLLSVCLLLPFAACGKTETPAPAPEPIPEPAPAPEPAPEPEPVPEPEPEPIPVTYAETKVSLAENPEMFRLLGRAEITDKGMTCDWPASGIEFELNCRGTLTADCTITRNVWYRAFVDGRPVEPRVKLGKDDTVLTLAEGLEPGVHTVRLIQDSDLDTASGASGTFTAIHADCDPATWKATPQKALYFEFVGASTTSGCGSIGDNSTPWSIDTHSAYNSYAYQLCEMADADYSLVSKGGIGVIAQSNGKNNRDIYPLQNAYKSEKAYGFARKPDIVFLAIGNDPVTKDDNDQAFIDAMVELAAMVREKNGEDTPIVFLHNFMSTPHAASYIRLLEILGGKENNVYVKMMVRGNDGVIANGAKNGHPTRENYRVNAELLADYIKDIL